MESSKIPTTTDEMIQAAALNILGLVESCVIRDTEGEGSIEISTESLDRDTALAGVGSFETLVSNPDEVFDPEELIGVTVDEFTLLRSAVRARALAA